ncbi:unnamed protein product [Larinioides sclopetarius]|uniref:Uncharacterized protein n=1 Tax=Larinioides sclopetarius TaxID=280406 RepID=A0AAV2AAH3_9ARAC
MRKQITTCIHLFTVIIRHFGEFTFQRTKILFFYHISKQQKAVEFNHSLNEIHSVS